MTVRRIAALVLCAALVGCGSNDPETPRTVTAADDPIRHTTEENASLVLYVSNQSFEDDPVHLTVAIDGVEIVDGPFEVQDQHKWVTFPLAVPRGRHTLTATSATGVELTEEFRIPATERRWAVLNYWYYPEDGRHFSWTVSSEPVAFG